MERAEKQQVYPSARTGKLKELEGLLDGTLQKAGSVVPVRAVLLIAVVAVVHHFIQPV